MEPGSTIPISKKEKSKHSKFAVCKIYAWHKPNIYPSFSCSDGNPCYQIIKKVKLNFKGWFALKESVYDCKKT